MVISVMVVKGGTGKTTLVTHLIKYLINCGKKVLFIDLDPQANGSTFFMDLDEIEKFNIVSVLRDKKKKPTAKNISKNFDIIPATLELFKFDKIFYDVKGIELFIRSKLQPLLEQYDHVIIDTNSSLSQVNTNAIMMSDAIIAPVAKSSRMALNGLDLTLSEIRELKENSVLGSLMQLKKIYVVPTMISKSVFSPDKKKAKGINELFPECIVLPEIPMDGKISDDQDKREIRDGALYKKYCDVFKEIEGLC